MAIDYRDLGIRIKRRRAECNMSQADLAAKVHLSTQHISNVENAKSKISLEKLIEVANVLGCTLDELICGSMRKGKTVYVGEIAEKLEVLSDTELRMVPELLKNLNYMYKLMEIRMKEDMEE